MRALPLPAAIGKSCIISLYYLRLTQLLAMQFERTLIVAEEDSHVSYLEGCTAPSYDKNQVCLAMWLFLCRHVDASWALPRKASCCSGCSAHTRIHRRSPLIQVCSGLAPGSCLTACYVHAAACCMRRAVSRQRR